MLARVIVDVPAKQTNRAFDYVVPPEWEQWIEPGCRVGVPFGPRVVQGFVIELREDSEIDPGRLRPISQLLDAEPPLTPELIELGLWMSETYMCHAVTALQAMIPGALKARYERIVSPAPEAGAAQLTEDERAVFEDVRARGSVALEALIRRHPGREAAIKALLKGGVLCERQTVADRLKPKMAQTVEPAADAAALRGALERLPERSVRQNAVLAFFIERPEPVPMAELTAALGVGSETVKALAKKGLLKIGMTEIGRDPYGGRQFARTSPLPLTEDQRRVFAPIAESLKERRHREFLLHGVTGSGKTEIYLQAIDICLRQGREAIVLVPEIALTPQMVDRFKGRFGDLVAVLHSRLSQGERYDEWRKIQRGSVRVVIGARSAIFAPFTDLGLIVIDEEHESSYKQDESPKYHARDVASRRAARHHATLVLGSATPSMESYRAALAARPALELLSLPARVGGRPLPEVNIVDMRNELRSGNRSMFSRPLRAALTERLSRGEQTVMLLNRRGYATFVLCRSCGHTACCPHCDIALTYHLRAGLLRCHYCGHAERHPECCPSCGSPHIRHFGTGTQRVEEELIREFPGIRVIRMDVDTTAGKGAHEKWLTMFKNGEADVLLGTQMVAKGLDFPNVTLVGVIAADSVLHLPDFRAAERTFQLLTQVAGRAGRHRLPGEVIIQTYNPGHYSIDFARRHDYAGFARTELEHRARLGYPPFSRIVLMTLSHEERALPLQAGEALVRAIGARAAAAGLGQDRFDVLGPVPAPIPRVKDRYRFQCMVKYRGNAEAARLLREALEDVAARAEKDNIQISVDVDPQSLM